MNSVKRLLSVVLILMMCLSGTALAASGQHEVTASGKLCFREEASSDSRSITALSKGTVVTVLSTDDGWAKARWNGKVGYLSCEYLDRITAASVGGKNTTKLSGTAWAEKNSALYEAADSSSDKLGEVAKGAKLTLCGETLNYYYVKADGKQGYILKNRVTAQQTASSAAASGESASQASSSSLLRRGDSGSAVSGLQERLAELGYMDEKYVTGYFGDLTHRAVLSFQTQAGLDADGVVGPATTKKLNSSRAPKRESVVEMDWYDSDVSSLVYKRGGTATIIDCRTGVSIDIRRVGGSSHMDVEPLTERDTGKLLDIYGGSWSWDRRPVILIADGRMIAASINGMPHGDEISTTNGFEGQFCLHTTGSKTHGSDKVDSGHQRCIEEALNYM